MGGPPTLRGTRVTLRPARHEDAAHIERWASDADFAWYQWGRLPGRFRPGEGAAWIDRFVAPAAALFILEHQGGPIGFANYRDLRPKGQSAEVGIGIGEKALWSKGLGREALALLIRHLFEDLGLHRVSLHTLAFNDRAIASYKAVGFEVEGVERDGVMTDRGEWADDVWMALVRGHARPKFDPVPVTLAGDRVRLEPLRMDHAEELFAAGDDPDIWTHVPRPRPRSVEGMAAYIREALDQQTLGRHVPWLTRLAADGHAIGTTRYANIDRANRSLEIGWTFLSFEARRTAANTEAKYLQLRHAFETLGAVRVWLQTDKRNERSQRAIERLGATREAELRKERVLYDGHLRTTVVYSILDDEWPAVKARLEAALGRVRLSAT